MRSEAILPQDRQYAMCAVVRAVHGHGLNMLSFFKERLTID